MNAMKKWFEVAITLTAVDDSGTNENVKIATFRFAIDTLTEYKRLIDNIHNLPTLKVISETSKF